MKIESFHHGLMIRKPNRLPLVPAREMFPTRPSTYVGAKRRQQQQHLKVMLRGFYQYFALHHCDRKLSWIRHEVQRHWVHALQRRGQRQRISWVYLSDRPWFELPSAFTLHPAVSNGGLRKSHLGS